MNTRTLVFSLLMCMTVASGAQALRIEHLDIEAGITTLFNSDATGAPSPIVLPEVGISLPLMFDDSAFHLLPRLAVFGTDYLYTGFRPIPAEVERAQFFVLGISLDILAGYGFAVSESIDMAVRGGITVLIRVPISVDPPYAEESSYYTDYFYGNARFIYPEVEYAVRWKMSEDFSIALTLRALIPLFHLWDGESLPFYDQLMVSGILGFSINL